MTVNELAAQLCEFTFDDASSMKFIRSLSGHFHIDVSTLRNEIAIFKIFVILWFVYRSALFSKRYPLATREALQSAYVLCLVKRPKPQEDQDFFGAGSGQRIDIYNAAYDAWHSARQGGNPQLHMYDVADAFSRFCGVDPTPQPGLVIAVYEYLMKDLWFAVGRTLEGSELR
jgi:hypothetical protein